MFVKENMTQSRGHFVTFAQITAHRFFNVDKPRHTLHALVHFLGPYSPRVQINRVTYNNVFKDWRFTTTPSEFVPLTSLPHEIPDTKEGKIKLFVDRCMVRDEYSRLTFGEIVNHPTFHLLIPIGKRTSMNTLESILGCKFVRFGNCGMVESWNFRR